MCGVACVEVGASLWCPRLGRTGLVKSCACFPTMSMASEDVSTWSESLPPLQLTRAEAEATQAAALSNVLTEDFSWPWTSGPY